MSKRYCKKSSVQSVADEVKTLKGSSSNIQGNNIASDISNLVIPEQRGAPEAVLTASSTSKTIQRGKYTGGSVSVVPQNATATLSKSGGNVSIESGKTLASVKIPASNLFQSASGTITPSSNATSIGLSNLSFRPIGAIFALTAGSGATRKPKITYVAYTQQGMHGNIISGANYGGAMVNAATVSVTDNSITISNIRGVDGSTSYTGDFLNAQYSYFAWG